MWDEREPAVGRPEHRAAGAQQQSCPKLFIPSRERAASEAACWGSGLCVRLRLS